MRRRFSPVQLSGCVLWLDASRKSSLFTTYNGSTNVAVSGDPIGRWEDISGNGNHAAVTASADRPTYLPTGINSLPAVAFDGVGDVLSTPAVALTTATIFLFGTKITTSIYGAYVKLSPVPSDSTGNDGRVLYDGIGAGTAHYLANPSTTVYQELDTTVGEAANAGIPTVWTWGWGATRATWFLRRGGIAATQARPEFSGTAVAPGPNPLHLNRGYSNTQGQTRYGEVIAFNRVLSLTEIKLVEAFGRAKRAI